MIYEFLSKTSETTLYTLNYMKQLLCNIKNLIHLADILNSEISATLSNFYTIKKFLEWL